MDAEPTGKEVSAIWQLHSIDRYVGPSRNWQLIFQQLNLLINKALFNQRSMVYAANYSSTVFFFLEKRSRKSPKNNSIMEDINIILHNSITSFEVKVMSFCLSIASRKPEKPTPTNNWHLSNTRKHTVSPKNAEGAAIILPFRENKV